MCPHVNPAYGQLYKFNGSMIEASIGFKVSSAILVVNVVIQQSRVANTILIIGNTLQASIDRGDIPYDGDQFPACKEPQLLQHLPGRSGFIRLNTDKVQFIVNEGAI